MERIKENFEEELTAVLAAMLGCETDEILDIFKSKDSDLLELSAQALAENASAGDHYEVNLENLKKEIKEQEEWREEFGVGDFTNSDDIEDER